MHLLPSHAYHHGDLKKALISASHKILNERGAEALSLRAIAAEAGVSHMAPYAHFKNKKALFEEVAASGFETLTEMMLKNSEGVNKAGALILSYGASYIEFALAQPQLYRLMLGQVENTGRRVITQNSLQSEATSNKQTLSPELQASSKKPFVLLETAFSQTGLPPLKVKAQALGAWSMVHGMAALLIEGHFEVPKGMSIKDFLALAALDKPV